MSRWMQISVKNGVVFSGESQVQVGEVIKLGLGSMELKRTAKAGLHIVRTSSRGNFTYALCLNRDGDYRLGADRGHRIVPPSEEKDPIKKVLREKGIPISKLVLQKEGEVLHISTFSCDIHRAYHEGTRNNWYLTDGKENTEVESYKDMTKVNQFCGPEVHEGGTITEATYAIEVTQRVHMNSCIGKYFGTIHVWPKCDPCHRRSETVLDPAL